MAYGAYARQLPVLSPLTAAMACCVMALTAILLNLVIVHLLAFGTMLQAHLYEWLEME
ncbi:hypothetical protein SD209_32095 [Pseudomonas aeruginosa]|uniref:hypothetical protein n=1 Tax=Pseudomonas aeruginosa TaxID=287 RepID=UPI0029901075|nr:hypothetical protein [Pseudomonas aeruginosa]WPD44475.1 hypothetical protein SD209_32095 [Pseudomonas aeruginosa]